jgi:hypothetical protein
MSTLPDFLAGIVTMAHVVATIFFIRFWVKARDPLFLTFAAAFFLFALNQALIGIFGSTTETRAAFYSLRLVGFLLIIVAIVHKNIGRPNSR